MLVAEIGALDLLVAADRRRRARGDDAAVDQHGDAVGEREHRLHVVLDQHDGDFPAAIPAAASPCARIGDAESGHRLVEQQQLRLGRERDRQFELALLAMAQLGDRDIGAPGEPDALERCMRGCRAAVLLARVAPETERVAVMRLRRQRDIVDCGEVRQRRDLERAREPERTAPLGRKRVMSRPLKRMVPAVGR